MRSGRCASRNSRASLRAVGRFAAATESSRSRISASAPLSSPRASLRSLSAGTNSIERMKRLLTRYPAIGPIYEPKNEAAEYARTSPTNEITQSIEVIREEEQDHADQERYK